MKTGIYCFLRTIAEGIYGRPLEFVCPLQGGGPQKPAPFDLLFVAEDGYLLIQPAPARHADAA